MVAGRSLDLQRLRPTKHAKLDAGPAKEAGDIPIQGKRVVLYRKPTKLLHLSSGRCDNLLSLISCTILMCQPQQRLRAPRASFDKWGICTRHVVGGCPALFLSKKKSVSAWYLYIARRQKCQVQARVGCSVECRSNVCLLFGCSPQRHRPIGHILWSSGHVGRWTTQRERVILVALNGRFQSPSRIECPTEMFCMLSWAFSGLGARRNNFVLLPNNFYFPPDIETQQQLGERRYRYTPKALKQIIFHWQLGTYHQKWIILV